VRIIKELGQPVPRRYENSPGGRVWQILKSAVPLLIRHDAEGNHDNRGHDDDDRGPVHVDAPPVLDPLAGGPFSVSGTPGRYRRRSGRGSGPLTAPSKDAE
jgi:hypothetical protein